MGTYLGTLKGLKLFFEDHPVVKEASQRDVLLPLLLPLWNPLGQPFGSEFSGSLPPMPTLMPVWWFKEYFVKKGEPKL